MFNPVDWENRRERTFDRNGAEVAKLRRVSQGIKFLGQQLGWSGDHFAPLTGRNFERRLLLDSTYGNINFQRFRYPYLADLNLVFDGNEGLINWVDFEDSQFEDVDGNEFLFPGSADLYHQSGFPVSDRPYFIKGSNIYIPEPFTIEGVDWDPEIEYIESRNAWRAKIKESGSLTVKRVAGPGQSVEIEVKEWNPIDLFPFPDRVDYYYGPWGSKGTKFTLEWLLTLLGLSGFYEEESLKQPPFTVRYVITDTDYVFDDILVDGEELGGRKLKGIESLTNIGSSIVRFKVDTGGDITFPFEKIEIRTINFSTNDPLVVDITELVYESKPPEIAIASVININEPPTVYEVEPIRADEFVADDNSGVGSDDLYIRLPFHFARGGEHWNKAQTLVELFTRFGKKKDEELITQYPGEIVHFYEEVWDNWRFTRFYHEDYLVSLTKTDRYPEEEGWVPPTIATEEVNERNPGWVSGRVKSYDPKPLRGVGVLGWEGSFYERVTEDSLSGFIERDREEFKVIKARDNDNPLFTPVTKEIWTEETNIVKVCYCYFVADFSAAEEPVF